MIQLKTFEQFGNVELTDFKPKPTTKTPGQVEASYLLWSSEDDKTKLESGNAQRVILMPSEPLLLNFVTSFLAEPP